MKMQPLTLTQGVILASVIVVLIVIILIRARVISVPAGLSFIVASPIPPIP